VKQNPTIEPRKIITVRDAIVINQVLWPFRFWPSLEDDGAPTTAMRMSGPIRTAIMSFATCSPLRTPGVIALSYDIGQPIVDAGFSAFA
jgi:hypothetical protein